MIKTTGLNRNNNEQYYTNGDVADLCVQYTNNVFDLESFSYIIEPSAGTGAFLTPLQQYDCKVLSYDIDPKHSSILQMDYLKTDISPGNILVIGNPPFGRQSSLAKQFIKHSCKFARVIAFILPKSFKKPSMYNAFHCNFHNVYTQDLENDSFIYRNQSYDVPCVFQIWERRDYDRIIPEKFVENEFYNIVKKSDNPDIAFRRVGVNAGKFTYSNFNNLSIESHYFIKCKNLTGVSETQVNNIKWDTNNTTGPKSISRQELIQKLNKIIT